MSEFARCVMDIRDACFIAWMFCFRFVDRFLRTWALSYAFACLSFIDGAWCKTMYVLSKSPPFSQYKRALFAEFLHINENTCIHRHSFEVYSANIFVGLLIDSIWTWHEFSNISSSVDHLSSGLFSGIKDRWTANSKTDLLLIEKGKAVAAIYFPDGKRSQTPSTAENVHVEPSAIPSIDDAPP